MKLFTAIVALAGMSSATASLRGGAVLPSEMKDLLSKLVAADEGTATCDALVGQMCKTAGGVVLGDCPSTSSCAFVGANNLGNWQHATVPGFYCGQPTVEAELVEESEYLQVASEDCKVLGPENGGCVPPDVTGLSCKEGYTCTGYSQDPSLQNANLGECVLNTNRSSEAAPAPTPSHAVICHNQFYSQNVVCATDADCDGPLNPDNCEAVCRPNPNDPSGGSICTAPLEEEEEELAASVN